MTPDQRDRALESVLQATIVEQRRARRWGIFFKLVFLSYLIAVTITFSSTQRTKIVDPHAAFIDIFGEIDSVGPASAESIIDAMHDAYDNAAMKGIILRINSGGGLPVQGSYVYNEVLRLKKLHPNIPVYAVIQDMGASAAYYIAVSADKIFANPDSIVGSIGVISSQYGLVGLFDKVGVESRVHTAGTHKHMLAGSLPEQPEELQMLQEMLDISHKDFINAVRQGRAGKLKKDPDLFSGRFWVGAQALQLGLIDGFGRAEDIAREEMHLTMIVNYTLEESIFDRVANRMQSKLSAHLLSLHPIIW